jgi:hypothetical protein
MGFKSTSNQRHRPADGQSIANSLVPRVVGRDGKHGVLIQTGHICAIPASRWRYSPADRTALVPRRRRRAQGLRLPQHDLHDLQGAFKSLLLFPFAFICHYGFPNACGLRSAVAYPEH